MIIKKRDFEQIKTSKAIYQKHAARHKAGGYPERHCKRMLAYTAALTKAIAVAAQR